MCGLAGTAGRSFQTERDVFKELLLLNQLRGTDGTGIAIVDVNLEINILKNANPVYDFLRTKVAESFLDTNFPKSLVTMGHTRRAYDKPVEDKFAHPFRYGHITLAHNGVIRSQGALKEWEPKIRIDSQEIALTMEKIGAKDTLEALVGDFALSWINEKEMSFNLARNEGRTLYFCTADKGKVLYYASEGGMLRWVLARNKVDIDDDGRVWELLPKKWVYWNLLDTEDFRKYERKDFRPYWEAHWAEHYREKKAEDKKEEKKKEQPIGKIRMALPTAAKQTEILNNLGLKPNAVDCMQFINYEKLPGDPTRCNITGNIQVNDFENNISLPMHAIIYATNIRVYDMVGHGKYANVKIVGVQRLLSNDTWVLVCEFVSPIKASVLDNIKNAHKDKKANDKEEPDTVKLDKPFIFPPRDRTRPIHPQKFGFNDKFISQAEWLELTKPGCALCEGVPKPHNHDRLIWLDRDTFVCYECAELHNYKLAEKIFGKNGEIIRALTEEDTE